MQAAATQLRNDSESQSMGQSNASRMPPAGAAQTTSWAQVAQTAAEHNAGAPRNAPLQEPRSAPPTSINTRAVKVAVSISAKQLVATATHLAFTYNSTESACVISVSLVKPRAVLLSKECAQGQAQVFNESVVLPRDALLEICVQALDQAHIVHFVWQGNGATVIVARRVRVGAEERDLHDVYGLAADKSDCVICLCEPSTATLMPCGHLCLCDECLATLSSGNESEKRCPVCRNPFERSLKVQKAAQ